MRKKGGRKTGGQQSVKTELLALKKKLGKNKRKIAALKAKVAGDKKEKEKSDVDFGEETDDEVDAGDCFGGKKTKKHKK